MAFLSCWLGSTLREWRRLKTETSHSKQDSQNCFLRLDLCGGYPRLLCWELWPLAQSDKLGGGSDNFPGFMLDFFANTFTWSVVVMVWTATVFSDSGPS